MVKTESGYGKINVAKRWGGGRNRGKERGETTQQEVLDGNGGRGDAGHELQF